MIFSCSILEMKFHVYFVSFSTVIRMSILDFFCVFGGSIVRCLTSADDCCHLKKYLITEFYDLFMLCSANTVKFHVAYILVVSVK